MLCPRHRLRTCISSIINRIHFKLHQMKIEDQLCSLQQAKKLKRLGILQESLYCFVGNEVLDCPYSIYSTDYAYSNCSGFYFDTRVAAFTVAELGLMLPDDLVRRFDFPGYKIPKSKEYSLSANEWFFPANGRRVFGIRYDHDGNINIGSPNFHGTEAGARADLIIWLIENKWIEVAEINQRLTAADQPETLNTKL